MDLFDTNIFLVDRFFTRDIRHKDSKAALTLARSRQTGIAVFTWLEFLGIISFNVSPKELARYSLDFEAEYNVQILYPSGLNGSSQWWFHNSFVKGIHDLFKRRMTFADAALLWIAEQYKADNIVTWNPKHFDGRTNISVLTPTQYLTAMTQTP